MKICHRVRSGHCATLRSLLPLIPRFLLRVQHLEGFRDFVMDGGVAEDEQIAGFRVKLYPGKGYEFICGEEQIRKRVRRN